MIFSIVVCGVPGVLTGMWVVVRNACSIGPNHAQGSMVKGMRTIFFLIQFANDIITVDEGCGGGGGFV